MRSSAIIGATLALSLSSAAYADGMVERTELYQAPFTWTGLYIGVNGGYSWGRAGDVLNATSSQRTGVFRAFGLPAQTTISDVTVAGPALGLGGSNVDGWIGGGQIGYNIQSRGWVFGVEADLQWSGERGGANACSTAICGAGSAFLTTNHDLEWFGSVRVRAGVLIDPRLLVYGTGGLAYGHLSSDYTAGIVAGPSVTFNDDKTKLGWVIGGGAEWAIHRNLFLRAEYLYMDLGKVDSENGGTTAQVITPDVPAVGLTTVVATTVNGALRTNFTDQIFRIGLSYKFGEPEYRPLK